MKTIPEYHPQMIVNIRAFMDRVPVTGVAEARELGKCADLLEAIISGHYTVASAVQIDGPSEANP